MPIALRERLAQYYSPTNPSSQTNNEPDLRTSRAHGSLALTDTTFQMSLQGTPFTPPVLSLSKGSNPLARLEIASRTH